MEHEPLASAPPAAGAPVGDGRRFRRGVVAAGAAVGMTLAGLGIAAAQTDGSTTTAPPATAQPATPAPDRGPGFGHRGVRGGMMAGGIHGEFTTRAPGGGYQTVRTQAGEVTSVSASSITVKSEDGFTKTYVVDDDTMVNAGNDGIADVKQGDDVHVVAVDRDGKTHAVDVRDGTQGERIHGRWMGPDDGPGTPDGAPPAA